MILTLDLTKLFILLTDISWVSNILAIGVALGIGCIWYHKNIFGAAWMRLAGLTPEEVSLKQRAKTALIWQVPILFVLAADMTAFLRHLQWSTAFQGLIFGYNFGMVVALFIGIHYLYDMRPAKLYLITAGYSVIALSAMGLVIGLFL